MQISDNTPKPKNAAGLSPEAKEWLNALAMIAILPGTLLIIGLIVLASRFLS